LLPEKDEKVVKMLERGREKEAGKKEQAFFNLQSWHFETGKSNARQFKLTITIVPINPPSLCPFPRLGQACSFHHKKKIYIESMR
jgi:hypothetical protein